MIQTDAPSDTLIYLNDEVALDLTTLIETRAIIQANSGGGKSWAIRRILEQSYGKVQHIVVDVEGAFRTLRESYEYVLLGSPTADVDYPITPANAALLATTFLEFQTSVILDLFEILRFYPYYGSSAGPMMTDVIYSRAEQNFH